MTTSVEALEQQLDDFSPDTRRNALQSIAELVRSGDASTPALTGWVNTHLHTFHSFNAEGYSPSRIVWEGKKRGLDVIGSVDFDVLDAMEEMFDAGETLDARTVAAMESRVFVKEYADQVLNSPGEPGVNYYMGTGFVRRPSTGTAAAETLQCMRDGARQRNESMLERLRPTLAPMEIDYEDDVLPLTPGGNATERHMLAAFDMKSRTVYTELTDLAKYWSERLALTVEHITELLSDTATFRNTIRAKLMKRGGPGYKQPDESTFPPLEDVTEMIIACKAIPCATWLDGTTEGESDIAGWLDFFVEKGCLALNIIPDRNWNISDASAKEAKFRNFQTIVKEAEARDLIFSVGTEMNNYGLKFVDTFDAPAMAPFADSFRDGAYILYGHTVLERACGKGRMSEWASDQFGENRKAANAFYLQVGANAFPPRLAREKLSSLSGDCGEADILKACESF